VGNGNETTGEIPSSLFLHPNLQTLILSKGGWKVVVPPNSNSSLKNVYVFFFCNG
jgi:hypothetical protein